MPEKQRWQRPSSQRNNPGPSEELTRREEAEWRKGGPEAQPIWFLVSQLKEHLLLPLTALLLTWAHLEGSFAILGTSQPVLTGDKGR